MRWLAVMMCAGCISDPANPPIVDPGSTGHPPSGSQPTPEGGVEGGSATATVLASGLATPRAIAATGGYVYVTVPSGADDGGSSGGILRMPETGGAIVAIVSGVDSPMGLAVADTSLCFTTAPSSGNGSVACASTAGGGPVVTLAQQEAGLSSLVIDNGSVYWTVLQGGALVERAPVAGGGGVTSVTTALGIFAPNGIALVSGTVYFTVSQPGTVYRVPTTGGVAEALADPINGGFVDSVFDGTRVLAGGPAEILAFPTSGGAPSPLVQSLPADPGHLGRDTTHLYWTSPGDGQVYSLSLTQTSAVPVSIASDLSSPNAIAVDDAVYVTTLDGVVRIARSI